MTDATRQPARSYEFHPLVRELIESTQPEQRPGEGSDPTAERVFFRSNPSLGFPTIGRTGTKCVR